jgi:YVTN family beta-propeller protein
MNEQTAASGSRKSLFGRLVRFFLKALGTVLALIVLAIIGFNIYLSTRPAPKTVRAAGTIKVPAPFRVGRSFIDYMTISGQRLYAGYASAGQVGVIDLATSQPAGAVTGLGRTHGVAVVADRNLGFASDSGDGTVGVFDLHTLQLLQKLPAGLDTDAIIYDAKLNLVYAANHDGKTATLIDAATLKVVANVPLGGEPEYPQADPVTGIVYQNLEDTSELVVVDPQKQTVTQRYKLGPCEGPTGLALDAVNHRLFSACRSKHLVVLNSDTGEIVAALPIGAGVDGAGYDPVLRRVYTANAAATMTVIQQDSADQYRVLENAPTHFGGHSLVVDPATHRIYVAYFGSIAVYDVVP